jgi:hypothetical protein
LDSKTEIDAEPDEALVAYRKRWNKQIISDMVSIRRLMEKGFQEPQRDIYQRFC